MTRRGGLTVKLEGLDDLKAALKELPKGVQTRAVQDAMTEALQPMLDDAARRAPRRAMQGGTLSNALAVSGKLMQSQRNNVPKKGRHQIRLFAGPLYSKHSGAYAPYAHLVEFGTGPRYNKAGKYLGTMRPQPFMRPAFDAHVQGFIRKFNTELVGMVMAAAVRARKRHERKMKRLAKKGL